MTKEISLRMPDDIYEILVKIRENFRVAMNAKIMDYIARGLINDKYYPINKLFNDNPKRYQNDIQNDINLNPLPEDVKFCDGDKCEIDYSENREVITQTNN